MTKEEIDRRGMRATELLEEEMSDPTTPAQRVIEIWAAVYAAGYAPITAGEALAVLESALRRRS